MEFLIAFWAQELNEQLFHSLGISTQYSKDRLTSTKVDNGTDIPTNSQSIRLTDRQSDPQTALVK